MEHYEKNKQKQTLSKALSMIFLKRGRGPKIWSKNFKFSMGYTIPKKLIILEDMAQAHYQGFTSPPLSGPFPCQPHQLPLYMDIHQELVKWVFVIFVCLVFLPSPFGILSDYWEITLVSLTEVLVGMSNKVCHPL